MLVNKHRLEDTVHDIHVATYKSPRDLLHTAKKGKQLASYDADVEWAGGSWDYFERGLTGDVMQYCDAADKVTQFGNVALSDYAIDYDYNTTYGVLDYGALVAGNPAAMYGATYVETDKSPIEIYIDTWTRADIAAADMERRGVAILALVQALQVFRPVHVYLTKASQLSPLKRDTLQLVPVPTQPLDLSRASFMLCSPTVNRWGLLAAIHAVHNNAEFCYSPRMRARDFQDRDLPKWVAKQHGVKDYLFMSGSFDSELWSDDDRVVAWIKEQLVKFMPENNS